MKKMSDEIMRVTKVLAREFFSDMLLVESTYSLGNELFIELNSFNPDKNASLVRSAILGEVYGVESVTFDMSDLYAHHTIIIVTFNEEMFH